MDETIAHSAGDPGAKPATRGPVSHSTRRPRWFARNFYSLIALLALSTLAGFVTGRFHTGFAKLFESQIMPATPVAHQETKSVATPDPERRTSEIQEISRLAPQQQAERLLELAIQRPDVSLDLIHRNLSGWRGRLQETDRLFHLVLAALDSEDPRVRVAAVEIDLAACHLIKAPESVGKLLRQIHGDSSDRYLALWRLGAIGNRGVEPARALAALRQYAHDANQLARFWAVEGLAMLGTRESLDVLLDILAHDPAPQIRERAATGLSRSGLFTAEQRLTAVPALLNLLDDDSLDAGTQNLIGSTLEAITGASFGSDANAWREWWAHHDRPQKPSRNLTGITFA